MAIYGAVGYRANRLKMMNGKLIVESPMFCGFYWPEPVMWARCSNRDTKCPKDEDGHIISAKECSCGIYSTTSLEVLGSYVDDDNYVPILVEALGYYWFHQDERRPEIKGLTSAGVQVAAVIKDFRGHHNTYPMLWIEALSSYYSVPLITIEEGDALIAWAWERFYPKEIENEPSTEPDKVCT